MALVTTQWFLRFLGPIVEFHSYRVKTEAKAKIFYDIYRPQRSCGQGNIFTPVCHSVHRGGCT